MSDSKGHNGITEDGTSTTLNAQEKERPIIAIKELENATTRNPILRILRETYGAETVFKWGTAILDRIQQTKVLQQKVHERSVSAEAENGGELVYSASVCEADKTERIVRNLWEYEKCGCTPQGWKPGEQLAGEFAEALQELPLESSQASEALLNMWCNGKGLWLLQQALYSIQKIRESTLGERTGGGDAMTSVVRRLTPLE